MNNHDLLSRRSCGSPTLGPTARHPCTDPSAWLEDRLVLTAVVGMEVMMDTLGIGPLLEWLTALLGGMLGRELSAFALPLAYIAYAAVMVTVLTLTRRAWRFLVDVWLLIQRPLARIRTEYGLRHPLHAARLARRLVEDTNVAPVAPLASLVQSTLWFFAFRNVLVPWQDPDFRAAVDQAEATFFGLSLTASFENFDAWIVFAITAVLIWFTVWSVHTQLKARMMRRSWLLQQFPPRNTRWVPLAGVAAYLLLLYQLTNWVPSLPVPWSVFILAIMLIPAHVAARRQDLARKPLPVALPDWVLAPTLPAPERRQPAVPAAAGLAGVDGVAQNLVAAPADSPRTTLARSAAAPTDSPGTAAYAATALMPDQPGPHTRVASPEARATRQFPARWSAMAPAPTPLTSREPTQLGPYTITGRIGTGGMAIVYLAESRRFGRIALKVANPLTTVDDANRRLVAEIQTLARVADPTIVEIHDAGVIDDHPYLAMAYLQGPTLFQAVQELGPLGNRQALRAMGERLAQGLVAIHKVGIHRDLKPANIIFTDEGPVIVDLGIAKLQSQGDQFTRTGFAMGTAGYAAPEILRAEEVTPAADVFAWGACVAFAATGLPLFGGGPLATQLDAVRTGRRDPEVMAALEAIDPALARMVHRCTSPDPAERPADGTALLQTVPRGARWTSPSEAIA